MTPLALSQAAIPATRTQAWLARGAIVACVLLLIVIKAVGPGDVTSTRDGSTTLYTPSLLLSMMFGALGILACVLTVILWMQPGRLFKFFSIVACLLAVYTFVNVPNGFTHRVVVTPEGFYRRVGTWYQPVEQRINFDDVEALQLMESESSRNGQKNYDLLCVTRPNRDVVAVPIFDMMKQALPEIIARAEARGVAIGKSPQGWQIPPDLAE